MKRCYHELDVGGVEGAALRAKRRKIVGANARRLQTNDTDSLGAGDGVSSREEAVVTAAAANTERIHAYTGGDGAGEVVRCRTNGTTGLTALGLRCNAVRCGRLGLARRRGAAPVEGLTPWGLSVFHEEESRNENKRGMSSDNTKRRVVRSVGSSGERRNTKNGLVGRLGRQQRRKGAGPSVWNMIFFFACCVRYYEKGADFESKVLWGDQALQTPAAPVAPTQVRTPWIIPSMERRSPRFPHRLSASSSTQAFLSFNERATTEH